MTTTPKTVGQLISELSKFPPDMPIMIYDFQRSDEWIPDPVVRVRKAEIAQYRGQTSYIYPFDESGRQIIDIVSIDLS